MRKEVLILVIALVVIVGVASAKSAPLIKGLDREIIVCEGTQLSLEFSAVEIDGESLTAGIVPSEPFYVRTVSHQIPTTKIELFSGNLTKFFANKKYNHTVYVSDGEFSDSRKIEIVVLEKNNPPVIEHLSVETIDLNKTKNFTKQVRVSDLESGNHLQGNLKFTVSDKLNLLDMEIDDKGLISYTPSHSHIGVHEITVCATDSGIENIQDKIGLCTSDKIKETTCGKFQLAIVNDNTRPTILSHNSSLISDRIIGTQKLSFQIFKYDPEKIFPDTYWYVDNQLKQINSGKASDTFNYSFGCNVWGRRKIKAIISDGLQNDSVEWVFDVIKVPCPDGVLPRETVGDPICEEKWGCLQWGLCQNVKQSFQSGNLRILENEDLKKRCEVRGFDETTCGFQTRSCLDVNNCNSIEKKPLETIPCFFSINPSCSDGIQNCHDGDCEFLPDCGGPCDPCPTCSDGFRNQGEEGIDCGGPCPERCSSARVRPEPPKEIVSIKQGIIIAIVIAVLIASIQIFRIMLKKQKLEEPPRRKLAVNS